MGFFCTGSGQRERAACMDGLWSGGQKLPLFSSLGLWHVFSPWLKRQTDSPSPAPRLFGLSCVEQQWRAVAARAQRSRAGLGALQSITGAASLENDIPTEQLPGSWAPHAVLTAHKWVWWNAKLWLCVLQTPFWALIYTVCFSLM